jgi:hypothetical protein
LSHDIIGFGDQALVNLLQRKVQKTRRNPAAVALSAEHYAWLKTAIAHQRQVWDTFMKMQQIIDEPTAQAKESRMPRRGGGTNSARLLAFGVVRRGGIGLTARMISRRTSSLLLAAAIGLGLGERPAFARRAVEGPRIK